MSSAGVQLSFDSLLPKGPIGSIYCARLFLSQKIDFIAGSAKIEWQFISYCGSYLAAALHIHYLLYTVPITRRQLSLSIVLLTYAFPPELL